MKIKNASWTRFNKYLYEYWKLEAVVIILGLIAMPLALLNPYLTKLAIDKAYGSRNLKLFLILAVIGGTILVLNSFIQSLNSYFAKRINSGVSFKIAKDVFSHLQSLPLSFFNNESNANHIYKISSDVTNVSSLICDTFPQIITLLPRLFFTLIIIFYLNWRLALLALILVPAAHIRTYFFGRWLRKFSCLMIEKSEHVFRGVYEVFSHMHLVKAFGRENYEIKKFEENLSKAIDVEIKNVKLGSINSFSGSLLDKAIGGAIALYGGWQIIKGTTTLGNFTAVMIYSTQLIGLMNSFKGFCETITINSVSCLRLASILDIKPEVKFKENAADCRILQGTIEFRDVYFGYKEGEFVLKGLNFSIPPASKIAIVGPSGTGKTTLLSLILLLYEPVKGSIQIDGQDIRRMKLESLKEQIGIALQEPFLLNSSIKDNILYGKVNASIEEITEALRIAEAHNFITSFPKQYDTQIGENACKISEGQKQRIAIARAIIKKPKILILDEGMSSLDSHTEDKIINNLKCEFKDSTIIVVSHRFSTAQKMDLVYFLSGPSDLEIGSHQELFENNPGYRELFASQIESEVSFAKNRN